MKTANRVLAILMAVLMACSTFAVAASAAGSLQTAIDNAPVGGTVSISQNTKESVTIDKNLTIDLGGKILKSANGSPAITVKKGATVTIQNGYVESYYYSYSGVNQRTLELLGELTTDSPAAIQASGTGTTVILNDVRVMGGLLRIPKTTEWFVPTGSAVKIYGGANAVLNSAVLIGSYGVSNDPSNTGTAQGKVTVNEAIIIGYVDYVKRVYNGVVYDAATVERVNAKDRITGFLNKGITLTEGEQDILNKALDDRIYIFTKKPVDDTAIVTLNKNTGWAKITASEVEHLEREIGVPKSTDCSYKYVPVNAYDVESGKTYKLYTTDSPKEYPVEELEGKEIRINYRLYFELKGDIKKLANNFDAYYERYYNAAIRKADAAYAQALDMYQTSVIDRFVELYKKVDEAGQKPAMNGDEPVYIDGRPASISNALGDDFYAVERALLSIGGVTMYNKATGTEFTTNQFGSQSPLYNYGNAPIPDYTPGRTETSVDYDIDTQQDVVTETTYVKVLGPLDTVDLMVEDFKATKGNSSFGDQTKWDDYVHFVINNYEDVLGLVDTLQEIIDGKPGKPGLKTTLTTGAIGEAIERLGMSAELNVLTTISNALRDVKTGLDVALDHPMVKDFLDNKIKAHANDGTVEEYTNKLIRAVNNPREYFTPEKFVTEDGKFGKTYTVSGPTTVKVIEEGKLNVLVLGDGVVNYTPDIYDADQVKQTEEFETVPYSQYVTLNAVAGEGNEFLYYLDSDTQRILTTNPTFVINTQVERFVEAVFETTEVSKVYFTNHSGVLCEDALFTGSIDASSIAKPIFAGYDVVGWGPNGASTLTTEDFVSSYKSGNSAFEDGASYSIRGFAFPLNSTTDNKYLTTPKYEAAENFDVTFIDGETEWSKTVRIGDKVTYTAQGDGFKYWLNDQGQKVSVYRTYSVQVVAPTTLTAVYEGEVNPYGYVNIVAEADESDATRVYAERSIAPSYKVLSNGILVSFTSEVPSPTVADLSNPKVKAVNSTKRTNEGVLTAAITDSTLSNYGGAAYLVAFVEVQTATGSHFIYSEPAYPIGG